MKKLMIMFSVLLLLSITGKSFAWFDAGHMIVAQIAYNDLNDSEKTFFNNLINNLKDVKPKYNNFVSASCWMDGIRSLGLNYFDAYHYKDTLYNPDFLSPEPKTDDQDAVWAIYQSISILKNIKASDFTKAFSLRLLIHMVGDIHQPMHAIAKVIKIKDNFEIVTDRGGNEFYIEPISFGTYFDDADQVEKPSILNNLHRLWDSGVTGSVNVQARNYDKEKAKIDESIVEINNYINSLSNDERKQIDNRINDLNIENWAHESYKLAIDFAYTDIKEGKNEAVSSVYIERGKNISKIQVYIAGKRLALLLQGLFPNKAK